MEQLQQQPEQKKEDAPVEHMKPNKRYICFAEAHDYAKSLSFKNRKEWRAWVRGEINTRGPRPTQIPGHPDGIYKTKGWKGWKHWLGTERLG